MNETSELNPQSALAEAIGNPPFPWQVRLLQLFLDGRIPRALDLPTGLGKTSVMAIWLVARACGAAGLPRRLVYVVDRRAVVDQATAEAESLRCWTEEPNVADALGIEAGKLPISTLRGQFVDNREWLEDPTSPAIIVGTVDMVGSRVLFEGYGCSRKMRPYHAGMLGADTLFVVDEAHLVPPFEHMLDAIVGSHELHPVGERRSVVPPSRLLSLSATGRDHGPATFRIDKHDREHREVRKRLTGAKRARLVPLRGGISLADALASHAWALACAQNQPVRVLVFSNKREDADKARTALLKLAAKERGKLGPRPGAELFVGGRRVCERVRAAGSLAQLGFLAGSEPPADHAFVFATSAGEVGVDLDADHMVGDIVAWERMVQRLGRVNRRGQGEADIILISADDDEPADPIRALVQRLPQAEDGRYDVSLAALEVLRRDHGAEIAAASTPEPLFPPLSRAVVDAWSMTSLEQHTGRPEVAPWLRGWIEDEPQTTIVWRAHLPHESDPYSPAVRSFFEAAPPHLSERLDVPSYRVRDWLLKRCARVTKAKIMEGNTIIGFCLDGSRTPRRALHLRDLATRLSPRQQRDLDRDLSGGFLVLVAGLGGLSEEGLLDDRHDERPTTGDVDSEAWTTRVLGRALAEGEFPPVPFRVSVKTDSAPIMQDGWRERLRLRLSESAVDEDVTEWLVVEKWRHDGATEDDRSAAGRPQTLAEHHAWTAAQAERIADRLMLAEPWRSALVIAARVHDEGKRAQRWQRAFHAPSSDVPYAKTRGPLNLGLLSGYRHELGSLLALDAGPPEDFAVLPVDAQALCRHLVVAHHGFARPVIRTEGCEEAPPSVLAVKGANIATNFASLQAAWGPWGLAWWETLVRAADQRASRLNDDIANSQGQV